MAKKPKKGAADATAEASPPAEAGEAAPAGGKKKLIIIVAAAVLLLGGGGGGGYWWFAKKKQAEAAAQAGGGDGHGAPAQAAKKTAFIDMKEMLINLGGQNTQQTGERPRFLKMKIALEVSDPKIVTEVQPLLPIRSRSIRASFAPATWKARPGSTASRRSSCGASTSRSILPRSRRSCSKKSSSSEPARPWLTTI
jgi:flagellar basal body-associated protein FliL